MGFPCRLSRATDGRNENMKLKREKEGNYFVVI
jgi:hypothetical protein